LHFAIAAGQRLFSEHTELTRRHVVEVRDRQPLITVVLIVQDDVRPGVGALELEEVLLRVGHRFGRVDLRRRTRDYVRGLLGPVGRKNGWQLAEICRPRRPSRLAAPAEPGPVGTGRGLRRPAGIRGRTPRRARRVLIIDETGFLKKGTTSAGVQRQYSGTAGRTENCVYTAIMSLDPTGKGQARWTMRWKTALNAFDITFDGRLSAARQ
jgi:hypothetical protein